MCQDAEREAVGSLALGGSSDAKCRHLPPRKVIALHDAKASCHESLEFFGVETGIA